MGPKVVNTVVTMVSHIYLLVELGPICNSIAASWPDPLPFIKNETTGLNHNCVYNQAYRPSHNIYVITHSLITFECLLN